jgi:hypothetical protein
MQKESRLEVELRNIESITDGLGKHIDKGIMLELMRLAEHESEFDQWLSDAQTEMQTFAEFLVSKLK